ncbi:MAG: acyltransferase family protein [Planctomycetaceae bacterium]|nr:acyltransferase family protein [Planctomycetaceae bacterium]
MEPAVVKPSLESQRIYYLDNLRALAMLLGVYLHGALAYAEPARLVWLATNRQGSVAVDASIWFIHLFRMSLFFLLAGYFAQLVWERKGLKQFLWGRFLRIVAPFLIFFPLLLIATTIVIGFALSYITEPDGLLGLIAAEFQKPIDQRQPPKIGTMHLWFLYYLFWFVLVSVVISFVWRLTRKPSLNSQPTSLAESPHWVWAVTILFVAPLILIPAALQAGSPMPATESFIPEWWPFAFYGLFYSAGAWLFRRERWLDAWEMHFGWLAIASGVMFCVYYLSLPELKIELLDNGKVELLGSRRIFPAVLTAYLSVWLTLLSLLAGRRFLSTKSGILSFISDSAYWVYLLHLPMVLFWQTFLIPLPWSLWIKLTVVLLGTTIPCLITYVVFVRYTPIGWLLHGKRSFP